MAWQWRQNDQKRFFPLPILLGNVIMSNNQRIMLVFFISCTNTMHIRNAKIAATQSSGFIFWPLVISTILACLIMFPLVFAPKCIISTSTNTRHINSNRSLPKLFNQFIDSEFHSCMDFRRDCSGLDSIHVNETGKESVLWMCDVIAASLQLLYAHGKSKEIPPMAIYRINILRAASFHG